MIAAQPPLPFFVDLQGLPLQAGSIFFGVAGQNPETDPVTVYWDAAGTQPALQPIRTINGMPIRSGTPAAVFINAVDYSMTVKTASGELVMYVASNSASQAAGLLAAQLAASGGSTMIGSIDSGVGAVPRLLAEELDDLPATPERFGAVGDGIADDTVPVQRAINTGRAVALRTFYKVTDALTCSTKGQLIGGTGRSSCGILVGSDFNLLAAGVFVVSSGEPGPHWQGMGIHFTQPDTSVRASLTAYPPAIYAQNCPRFTVSNVRITGARTGVDMRGNSGGAFFDLVEMAAFDYGVRIDGSLDSVRLKRFHFWNFRGALDAMTANQLSIFRDGVCIGLDVGTCDDFHVEDSLFIHKGPHIKAFSGVGGRGPFGNVVNCDFDTYGNVTVSGGNLNFSSCFFTIGDAAVKAIDQTGGYVRLTNCQFENAVALSAPMVQLSGSNGGSTLATFAQLSNCMFRITGDTKAFDVAASSGSSIVHLTDCTFLPTPNLTNANPLINIGANGRISAIGNRCSDKGTGSGNWLVVASDDHHVIIGNAPTGWGESLPSALDNGVAFGSAGATDAWRTFATSLSAFSGTFTSATATMRYKQIGKLVLVQFVVTITTNGTAAGYVQLTLPRIASAVYAGGGIVTSGSGIAVNAATATASSALYLRKTDGTYPGADGTSIEGSIEYESQ